MIGRYTEQALLKRAKEVVEEKGKGSDIFDEAAENAMPRFKTKGELCRIFLSNKYVAAHVYSSNDPHLIQHCSSIFFIRA